MPVKKQMLQEDLETMAQHIVKVNPQASLDLTLTLNKVSASSLRDLSDLGVVVVHRIPELNLVLGRITATEFVKSSTKIRRIAEISGPTQLQVQ
jgi:hypothetical protein